MKRFLIYSAVALALLVGAGLFTIDSIARSAIEAGVEEGLGVPADVGSVRLRLLLGSFRMSDLEIGNAPGYAASHFLKLGRAETQVSYAALRKGDVVLKRLVLADLDMQLEWKGTRANYDAILEGMGGSEAPPAEPAEPGSETRFIIDELLIQDVVAHLRLDSALGKVGEAEVSLPELRLEGIGRKTGGVAMAEVSRQVMKAVLAAVLQKGKGLGPAFSSQLGSGLQQLRGLSSGSTEEKLGKAGELLKGFFGKDDD